MRIPSKGSNLRRKLRVQKDKSPVGMKRQVPRPDPLTRRHKRRVALCQLAVGGVEAINKKPIGAQIRDQHEAMRRVDGDGVRVRTLLPWTGTKPVISTR